MNCCIRLATPQLNMIKQHTTMCNKCCMMFYDIFMIFQPTTRYRYQFVGKVMMDILNIKEIIQLAALCIPKGMKKNAVFISIAFNVNILIRNENIISEQRKTKTCLK